jgi:hypothetical protein
MPINFVWSVKSPFLFSSPEFAFFLTIVLAVANPIRNCHGRRPLFHCGSNNHLFLLRCFTLALAFKFFRNILWPQTTTSIHLGRHSAVYWLHYKEQGTRKVTVRLVFWYVCVIICVIWSNCSAQSYENVAKFWFFIAAALTRSPSGLSVGSSQFVGAINTKYQQKRGTNRHEKEAIFRTKHQLHSFSIEYILDSDWSPPSPSPPSLLIYVTFVFSHFIEMVAVFVTTREVSVVLFINPHERSAVIGKTGSNTRIESTSSPNRSTRHGTGDTTWLTCW